MDELEHEFIVVDVYAKSDRAMLLKHNPTLKIPMLDDNGQIVLDSRVIFQYLVTKGDAKGLSLAQQNLLSQIDAAGDSLVNLFLLGRSDIDTTADKLYFRLQHERLEAVFTSLERAVISPEFAHWDFLSMSLFALLDWVVFRALYEISAYPNLVAFHAEQSTRQACQSTDPR
jgi:glutathione S-transferase